MGREITIEDVDWVQIFEYAESMERYPYAGGITIKVPGGTIEAELGFEATDVAIARAEDRGYEAENDDEE